jgi:hypothetical protein
MQRAVALLCAIVDPIAQIKSGSVLHPERCSIVHTGVPDIILIR